ncbi:MAG: hypothetical protein JRJ84_08325 [Deltaproteobacteria bacterium]|nr:hypothetical protein [Deltaproteobacteria bacterium]
MRLMVVGALAMMATGCAELSLPFSSDGILQVATRGVVIHDDGTQANAGMYDTTCAVNTETGAVGADRDYPGVDEKVQDIDRYQGIDAVVVTSVRGIHITPADAVNWEQQEDIDRPNVLEARLVDDEVVILVDDPGDGCAVEWVHDGFAVGVDPALCQVEPDVSADPTLGGVYVAGGDLGAFQISQAGVTQVDAAADLAVFDAFAEVLYVARVGENWVRGLESSGDLLWETDLGYPVLSIDDMGWREAVAVLVEAESGNQVYALDAYTGEATLETETPAGAQQIVVSRNGRDYALVLDQSVHFRAFERHGRDQ